MRRMQIEHEDTHIWTYDLDAAVELTKELVDVILDQAYKNKSREYITLKHGRGAEDVIVIEYSKDRNDVIIFFDGFVIMPFELYGKLMDTFKEGR